MFSGIVIFCAAILTLTAVIMIISAYRKYSAAKRRRSLAENSRRNVLLKKAEAVSPDHRKRLEYLYAQDNGSAEMRNRIKALENMVEHGYEMLEKLSVLKGDYCSELKQLYCEYINDPTNDRITAYESEICRKFPYIVSPTKQRSDPHIQKQIPSP